MRAPILALLFGAAMAMALPLHAKKCATNEADIQPDTPMAEPIHYLAQGQPSDLKRLAIFARRVGFRIGRIVPQSNGKARMPLMAPTCMTYGDAAGVEEAVHDKEFGEVTLEGITWERK